MSTFLDDIIPTTSIPAAIDAARSIVIVKDFKIGGSAISSWLSENRSALWLDYEEGSEALPGVKINVIAKAKALGMTRIALPAQIVGRACRRLAIWYPALSAYLDP
jgi:hypothetical protein